MQLLSFILFVVSMMSITNSKEQQEYKNIIDPYFPKQSKYKVGLILYQNFTILDLAGPAEIFDDNADIFETITIGEKANSQVETKHQSLSFLAKMSMEEARQHEFDILMIPGANADGLSVMNNTKFMDNYKYLAEKAKVVFTVCTGSLILAKTGLIDGMKATTNKMAYPNWTPLFPKPNWVYHGRFVHHRKYITSSGISAGTDAAIYILSLIKGEEQAKFYARVIEYTADLNPDHDPFATLDLP